MYKIIRLILIIFIFSTKSWALDIDEKLTLRILKVSNSRKTILVNRGIEDGLVVGDHAKFFLTSGIIARGVVRKTSPTRSVWSLYRVVNSEHIESDKVLSLKISSPLKLSEDPTTMIAQEDATPLPTTGVVLSENVTSGEIDGISIEEEGEISTLKMQPGIASEQTSSYETPLDKTWEGFATAHMSSFSTSVESSIALGTGVGGGAGSNGNTSAIDLTFGVEKYFQDSDSWWSRFSLIGVFHYTKQAVTTTEGYSTDASAMEFGIGSAWHFLYHPSRRMKPIGFIQGLIGTGSASDSFSIGFTDTNIQDTGLKDGQAVFASVGAGVKLNLIQDFGGRLGVDYYQRQESYDVEIQNKSGEVTKTVSGVRVSLGLSYRFL